MIKPEEIVEKEFKKAFRGYSETEVDIYLDQIKEDYEVIVKENEAVKEKLSMYKEEIKRYSNIEETLKETLITAQSAAEDTTSAANKKARIIVQEAELQAKQMIDSANNRVVEIRKEYDSLLKEFKVFRNKFKSLLNDEIKNVDDIFSDAAQENGNFNESFKKVDSYETTGTMRMAVLEDVQEEVEQHTMEIKGLDELKEENAESKAGSPEDIFNIK